MAIMNYTVTSLWVQYSKDIYETEPLTRSDTSTSTTQNYLECHQNISLVNFLVITSIQLLSQDSPASDSFKSEIELKLTTIYREAGTLINWSYENVTVNILNITVRPHSDGDEADILYYLMESVSVSKINSSVCLTSLTVTYLMDVLVKLKGIQYLALKIGRIVLIPVTQVFQFELTKQVEDGIGAGIISGIVISSLIGCFLVTWCALFVYFKCQLSRKIYCNKSVMCQLDGIVYDQQTIVKDEGVGVDLETKISQNESNKYEMPVEKIIERRKNTERRKKQEKNKRNSTSKGQPHPPSEVIILSGTSHDIEAYSHVGTKPIISEESKSTPPPDKMSSNEPTATLPKFIPSISVDQIKSNIVWNPYEAADKSRQIMLEEKHKNRLTTQVDADNTKTQPIKERVTITYPIASLIKYRGPIMDENEYIGPISEADMRNRLNFINILHTNNMLDENYSSIILNSRDL